jgi:acyl dehydratase
MSAPVSSEGKIDRFAAGDSVTIEQAIGVGDIDRFAELSGDTSAIHMSADAAAYRGFSGRVAHGMLLGAWVSAVIGTRLPGDCGVLQTINFAFRAPVIPPDMLKITVSVAGKSEAVGQLKLSIRVERSDGVVAATGEARSIIR